MHLTCGLLPLRLGGEYSRSEATADAAGIGDVECSRIVGAYSRYSPKLTSAAMASSTAGSVAIGESIGDGGGGGGGVSDRIIVDGDCSGILADGLLLGESSHRLARSVSCVCISCVRSHKFDTVSFNNWLSRLRYSAVKINSATDMCSNADGSDRTGTRADAIFSRKWPVGERMTERASARSLFILYTISFVCFFTHLKRYGHTEKPQRTTIIRAHTCHADYHRCIQNSITGRLVQVYL